MTGYKRNYKCISERSLIPWWSEILKENKEKAFVLRSIKLHIQIFFFKWIGFPLLNSCSFLQSHYMNLCYRDDNDLRLYAVPGCRMGGGRLAGAKNWSEAGQRMDCRLQYVFQMFTLAFVLISSGLFFMRMQHHEEADTINSNCILACWTLALYFQLCWWLLETFLFHLGGLTETQNVTWWMASTEDLKWKLPHSVMHLPSRGKL